MSDPVPHLGLMLQILNNEILECQIGPFVEHNAKLLIELPNGHVGRESPLDQFVRPLF